VILSASLDPNPPTSSSHSIYFIAQIEGKKFFGRTTNRTTEQK
jgi:hypothetical protein